MSNPMTKLPHLEAPEHVFCKWRSTLSQVIQPLDFETTHNAKLTH